VKRDVASKILGEKSSEINGFTNCPDLDHVCNKLIHLMMWTCPIIHLSAYMQPCLFVSMQACTTPCMLLSAGLGRATPTNQSLLLLIV